jgi:ubiquinone biosynthesis protein COQ4
MTNTLSIPDPPKRARLRWRTALRALRALLADPDDTAKAIELTYAIGRNDFERTFQRLAASPCGRRLLERRPSLAAALSDRAALEAMQERSFGRAYLEYLDRNGFTATSLRDLERRVGERWEREEGAPRLDPLRAWFRERSILTHDLFHVVTGYGTDDIGEATLLAFTLAQVGGRAAALLTAGSSIEVWRRLGRPWPHYAFRAWRRGRRAARLAGLPWEDLLALPLETVRDLAAVEPSDWTHPEGILTGRVRPSRQLASTQG